MNVCTQRGGLQEEEEDEEEKEEEEEEEKQHTTVSLDGAGEGIQAGAVERTTPRSRAARARMERGMREMLGLFPS